MKPIKFLFALLLFAGILSCKKGTDFTSAIVKVLDYPYNLYEPNIKVKLDQSKRVYDNGCRICSSHLEFTTLKEGYTDANGFFDFGEFETEKSDDYDYYVGNCNWDKPCGGVKISKGESNNITLNVFDGIPLTVKFIPPPPYNSGDSLRVDIINPYCVSSPTCNFFINNSSYLTNNYFNLGHSGQWCFNVKKYKSGVYTNTNDTVYYTNDSAKEYDVIW